MKFSVHCYKYYYRNEKMRCRQNYYKNKHDFILNSRLLIITKYKSNGLAGNKIIRYGRTQAEFTQTEIWLTRES